MSKKAQPEVPTRAKPKKGLVKFPSGNMTAQAIVEAAQHAKDRVMPSMFLVEGEALSVFSPLTSSSADNGCMTRTDIRVINEAGVRVGGRTEELSAEVQKTLHPSALQFEGDRVRILGEDGEVADGVGGPGIVSSDDPSTYWNKIVAPLQEVGSLPTSVLRGLLSSVQAFIGEDETRPHVNWTPIEVSQGLVQGVATNGHILVVRRMRSPLVMASGVVKVGVPRSAIRALSRFQEPTTHLYKHPDKDSTAWMACCGAHSVFMTHVNTFPLYDALLPSNNTRYVGFDASAPLLRSTVADVVQRANKTGKKAIEMTVEGSLLTFLVGDTALRWTIPIEWTCGKQESFRSVVGSRYLAQVVRAITDGGVTTRIERLTASQTKDVELTPLYIKDVPFGDVFAETDHPWDAITILMPMRSPR